MRLHLSEDGNTLYVSNGMDNAVCVINIGENSSSPNDSFRRAFTVKGFIPTEAYPAGLALEGNSLYVANLEGEGARTQTNNSYNAHHQEATISIITLPSENDLDAIPKE